MAIIDLRRDFSKAPYQKKAGYNLPITNQEIINRFEKLGLTRYEAKAYLALLRNSGSYGREISKQSGIPGAKVYETLERLVEKDLAYPIPGNPMRYKALPLSNFIDHRKKDFERTVTFLEKHEKLISKDETAEQIWHLSGKEHLIDKALEYIDSATSTIYISLWPEETDSLRKNLVNANKRGVKIVSIQYDGLHLDLGRVTKHVDLPAVRERHGSEVFMLVDDLKGVIMYFEELQGWKGFYTSSRGICRVIKNYITHDIYLNRIVNEHPDFIARHYGKNLELLIDL